MKRTSRSNSFDDWGHAWVSQEALPTLPNKRGREETLEVDPVQLRRQALRLCLEQARGSQGIYRADYGKSKERFIDSLRDTKSRPNKPTAGAEGAGIQTPGKIDAGSGSGMFSGIRTDRTPERTEARDQKEVGAMFAAPPTPTAAFPRSTSGLFTTPTQQSTGLFGASAGFKPSSGTVSEAPGEGDRTRKRTLHS